MASCNSDDNTVQSLIIDSIRMLGIYGEQWEDIPGFVQTRALRLLNENLEWHSSHGVNIPFCREFNLYLIVGQGEYDVSDNSNPIVELLYANIRLPSSEQYYNIDILTGIEGRLYKRGYDLNVRSRPCQVINKKSYKSSTLMFYPIPDQEYSVVLRAKMAFSRLKPKDILDEIPVFWRKYLRYELAKSVKNFEPTGGWTADMEVEFREMKMEIDAASPADYTPDIDSALLGGGYRSIRDGVRS